MYNIDLVNFTVILISLCSLGHQNSENKILQCSVLEGLPVKIIYSYRYSHDQCHTLSSISVKKKGM